MKRRAYLFIICTMCFVMIICGALSSPEARSKKYVTTDSYDVVFKDGRPHVDLAMRTADQAVQHAIDKRLLDMPDYEYVQNAVEWEIGWTVTARLQEGLWHVYIKTQKVIPSYLCGMIFKDQEDIEIKPCGWNK